MNKLIEAKAFQIGEYWYICARLYEDEKEKVVYYNYTFGCLQDVDRDDQIGNSKVVEYLGSITMQNDYKDD